MRRTGSFTKAVACAISASLVFGSAREAVAQSRTLGASGRRMAVAARPAAPTLVQALLPASLVVPVSPAALSPKVGAPSSVGGAPVSNIAFLAPAAKAPGIGLAAPAPLAPLEAAPRAEDRADAAAPTLAGLAEELAASPAAAPTSTESSAQLGQGTFFGARSKGRATSWVRAALLGLVLTFGSVAGGQTGPSGLSQPRSGLSAPAKSSSVKAPARVAPVSAARSLRAVAKLDRALYEPADSVQLVVTVSNDSSASMLFPGEAARLSLEEGLGGAYTVVSGPGGDVSIPAGRSVRIVFELALTAIPADLERGGKVKVAFPGAPLPGNAKASLPAFEFELKSSVKVGSKPALKEPTAWPTPWAFFWGTLLKWLGAAALVIGARALLKWLQSKPVEPPAPPVPDPAAVSQDRLGALEKELAQGVDQPAFYSSLAILADYFFSATLGFDDMRRIGKAASLADAARTLRALEQRLAGNAPALAVITRLREHVEQVLYAEKPLPATAMSEDLAAVRSVIDSQLAHYAAPQWQVKTGRYNLSVSRSADGVFRVYGGDQDLVKRIRQIVPNTPGHKVPFVRPSMKLSYEFFLHFPVKNGPFWIAFPDTRIYWPGLPGASAPAAARPSKLSGLAALGLASLGAGTGLAHPLWLLGLIPIAVWATWRFFTRHSKGAGFAAPSDWGSAPRTWRQRLAALAAPLRALALALTLVAIAGPTRGVREPPAVQHRERPRVVDTGIRSIDTQIVIDRSNSMFGDKIEEAKKAALALIEREATTQNRVGLEAFNDRARIAMNLTQDTQALKAAVSLIETDGGTDIAVALDAALEHFLEMNLLDLAQQGVPGAEAARERLKLEGLPAALEAAGANRALMSRIEASDKDRVIIFLTDGEGGDPTQSIERARLLNVKIYAVSVGYDANPRFLKMMAEKTRGRFFAVGDAAALTDVFLEIGGFKNKAPVPIISPETAQPIERDGEVALLAFLLLLASLAVQYSPSAPSSRGKSGDKKAGRKGGRPSPTALLALTLLLPQSAQVPPSSSLAGLGLGPSVIAQAPRSDKGFSAWKLLPYRPIPELQRANELFDQKKFAEARRAYTEAAIRYPNVPEAFLGEGMAARQLDQLDAAEAMLRKARDMAAEQARPDLVAAAENQLGLLAVDKEDPAEALKQFRLANRPRADGRPESALHAQVRATARHNFEEVLRLSPPAGKSNGGQGQSGQGDQNGKKQQQGNQQGKPQKGQGQGKPQQGQGKPQQGQGQREQIRKDGAKGIEKLMKSMRGEPEEKGKKGQGSSQGKRSAGRAWGAAPFLAFAPFDWLSDWLRRALAWFSGVAPNTPMHWTSPWLLWASGVAASVLAAFFGWQLWRQFIAARALSPVKPRHFFAWKQLWRQLSQRVLLLGALLSLGAAAAGPTFATPDDSISFGGKGVVFAQDISRSVTWATDGRYQTALKGLERFSYWINNENFGDSAVIIPFAGDAAEATLSRDHKNLSFQIYHMGQDGRYLHEGSSIGRALDRAFQVFEAQKIPYGKRVLIIMSDGGFEESTSSYESEAYMASAARDMGITIYTLGLGSDTPVPMAVPPDYVKDVGSPFIMDNGRKALTGIAEAPLRELAAGTGGFYQRVRDEKDVESVLHKIAHTEKVKIRGWNHKSAGRAFLYPAAVLLGLGFLLDRRRSSAKPPAPEPQDQGKRLAKIQQAAARIRFEKLLRGEFQAPDVSPTGVDPDDAVPYTNQPWRSVDQRASARVGSLQARRYEQEPDIPVWIVADLSGSSDLGTGGVSKRQAASDSAAAIALAASREDHPVGLIAFTDGQEVILPPKRGPAHAREIFRTLSSAEPKGRGSDLGGALGQALSRAQKRGVVVVLSDFQAEGYEARLAAAGNRHILLPIVLRDPLETQAPRNLGSVLAQDGETGRVTEVDTASRRVRRHIEESATRRAQQLRRALSGARARPVYLTAQDGFLDQLVQQLSDGGKP